MIETLIIPGLNGSPAGHWQHHWVAKDPSAEFVEQKDWAQPRLAEWLHALEERIEANAPGVILVAHSLGCALVGALAKRPAAARVGGALLVAPVDVPALAARHVSAWSFNRAQNATLPFRSIVCASRNDPYLSFQGAERQAAIWKSTLCDLGQVGHVNIASGFGPWPDATTLADGLRGRASRARSPQRVPGSWWSGVDPQTASAHDSGLGIS